jgi:hypothetical protein
MDDMARRPREVKPPIDAIQLNKERWETREDHARRSRTINFDRMSREDRRRLERRRLHVVQDGEYPRPQHRSECRDGPRPCLYVACQHHLYADEGKANSLRINFPDLEPHELGESCALDIAEEGGATLERVATAMGITRERVRQLEAVALAKLSHRQLAQKMRF